MDKEIVEMINSILVWWEEHEFDTTLNEEEEYNIYDEEPHFVKMAKQLNNQIGNKN